MKIIFVLEYYYPHIGGVETFFQKLAEGCIKRGYQVCVVTIHLQDTSLKEIYNGVEIIRIKTLHLWQRYWFTMLAFFKLINIAKEFDIIHSTTYNAALPAWLTALFLNKKVILTVHEVWGQLWHSLAGMNIVSSTLHRIFEWFILKLPFDYYITVSEFTKESLIILKKSKKNIMRIYHGIDYNFFNPQKYDEKEIRIKLNLGKRFIYTYFGRPGWAKGLDYLIRAVPYIKNEILGSKLMLILSHDPISRYLAINNLIKKLGIEDYVILLNSVPKSELPKYIIASNCVIIPSLSEGFGFSVAESCALGIPVAASYTGSIPEVISGKHIFFEPANHNSIAEAVIKIYKGEYLYKKKKIFNWIETINQYCQIYENL